MRLLEEKENLHFDLHLLHLNFDFGSEPLNNTMSNSQLLTGQPDEIIFQSNVTAIIVCEVGSAHNKAIYLSMGFVTPIAEIWSWVL